MLYLKDITFESAQKGLINLTDHGYMGEELVKLKALANLISYAGDDEGFCFVNPDVRCGIGYLLRDIADSLEKGLDHVSRNILYKISGVFEEKEGKTTRAPL